MPNIWLPYTADDAPDVIIGRFEPERLVSRLGIGFFEAKANLAEDLENAEAWQWANERSERLIRDGNDA